MFHNVLFSLFTGLLLQICVFLFFAIFLYDLFMMFTFLNLLFYVGKQELLERKNKIVKVERRKTDICMHVFQH